MNKGVMLLLGIVGVIFTGSLCAVLLGMRTPEQRIVQIVQDGVVLYTFDLNAVENQTIRIDAGDSYNIVAIENGEIYMSEAGCPDHTCIRMGTLRSETMPIVCLPNKLVIRFA